MRRLTLVLSLAVFAAACSLGAKADQADRVSDAATATANGARVFGVIGAELVPRPVDVPSGFEIGDLAIDFDPTAFSLPVATARFAIDGADGVASLGPDGDSAFADVLFDDRGIRLRRPDARPEDARPWLLLDYVDLTGGSGELESVDFDAAFGLLAVMDPRVVLDLAAGPLAGSIEVLGDETLDGRSVTHYAANFDIPKALRDERGASYDEDRLEHTEAVFDLLRVSGDVHPGDVWVTEDGLVSRFEIRLHVKIERFVQFDLHYDLRVLPDAAGPAPVVAPGPEDVVLVDSLVPLRNAGGKAAPPPLAGGLLGG